MFHWGNNVWLGSDKYSNLHYINRMSVQAGIIVPPRFSSKYPSAFGI